MERKKDLRGYSGVVIYTRNSVCCPIRAEEGITGVLCPPSSSIPFRDLPPDKQIGGYPTPEQLSLSEVDASTLDSEGRCVILEFPAFVLLGVYCPANRDDTRDDFRLGFLNLLDSRVRNLIAMGKRVILTGDINISRAEIDSAHAAEKIRKAVLTEDEYISAPSRRLFNQLVTDGNVVGDRDYGRETPVLVDLCREYHPHRRGMFTCWEQRVNARPGNYGARIDYVLCDIATRDWFSGANIQEGLMGSDHCPVYADLKDVVRIDDTEYNLLDLMNPEGTFENGSRKREYSSINALPLSGKLIPEFHQRRSIKDMFRQAGRGPRQSGVNTSIGLDSPSAQEDTSTPVSEPGAKEPTNRGSTGSSTPKPAASSVFKRPESRDIESSLRTKRLKRNEQSSTSKSQKTLKGFFQPKISQSSPGSLANGQKDTSSACTATATDDNPPVQPEPQQRTNECIPSRSFSCPPNNNNNNDNNDDDISDQSRQAARRPPGNGDMGRVDSASSKESWSKLFNKKPPPRCAGHNEPCVSLVTKKPGINCGRAFWICARPLGPTGSKKMGDEWRCETFIWSSDWNP
ncbi:hypothetical protein FQN50_007994 [Emmonsiellopsis sp. PD_5]|nr:hypothetical protein FQN50_007994 [Emmonsiellopsis sp. PD_5]